MCPVAEAPLGSFRTTTPRTNLESRYLKTLKFVFKNKQDKRKRKGTKCGSLQRDPGRHLYFLRTGLSTQRRSWHPLCTSLLILIICPSAGHEFFAPCGIWRGAFPGGMNVISHSSLTLGNLMVYPESTHCLSLWAWTRWAHWWLPDRAWFIMRPAPSTVGEGNHAVRIPSVPYVAPLN